MLGCVISEGTVEQGDRSSQAAGLDESNYSNFKAQHANMFTINSANNLLPEKHSSLSPKMKKHSDGVQEIVDAQLKENRRSPNTRKYHSTLNKKSEKRAKNHKMSSPLIRNDAAEDPTNTTI